MRRTRKTLLWAALALPLVAIVVFAGLAAAGRFTSRTIPDGPFEIIRNGEERVATAELIVRARFVESVPHSRTVTSPVDETAGFILMESFNRYEILEALKGDFRQDFLFTSDSTTGDRIRMDGAEGSTESSFVPLRPGAEYMLFLRSGPRFESDPIEFGEKRWHFAGFPGIAEIDGDRLVFLAPRSVVQTLASPLFPGSGDGKTPLLELTVSDVREMASG